MSKKGNKFTVKCCLSTSIDNREIRTIGGVEIGGFTVFIKRDEKNRNYDTLFLYSW